MLPNDPHRDLSSGYIPVCSVPEGSFRPRVSFECAGKCHACMVAAIAHAVNMPDQRGRDVDTGKRAPACVLALQTVRDRLEPSDPLRVRAEQVLVPLVAERPS